MPITSDATSVTVSHPDSPQTSIKILNYGATIISWKVRGEEKLWMSDAAKLDGTRAVRGGIPLVFPRFGPATGEHPETDKLPQHGFARIATWEFLGEVDPTTVQFGLGPEQLSDEIKAQWGYDFSLIATYKLKSNNELDLKISVENTDKKPFDFNVLYHTYFKVPEVENITIDGFSQLKFWSKLDNSTNDSGLQPVTIHDEFDNIYFNTPDTSVINYESKPLFTIEGSKNLTETVVWNPWSVGAESMTDFEPKTGFHQMICVENGNVAKFTSLAPGEKWESSVVLTSHM